MDALIYTRVSTDRAGGRSPAEQETEARALCTREGWNVTEVVTDSVGASRHSKGTRPGWARAKELVRSGTVHVLVTWEASRAQRDLKAYAELRDLCASSGVLWSYSGRTHDLTNKDDRFSTGLDALLAEREADEIASRVQRAMRANAAAGRPHGRRLFGYIRVYDPMTGALIGQEPHPDEAPVVRRIFDEYLTGTGIRTIAAGLNRDGITTSTGATWNDGQVRRVIVNPAYTARRVHQGVHVGDAAWMPLIAADRFDLAQHRLAGKQRVRQTPRARLLTGVARCGECGGKMIRGHDRNQRSVYLCRDRFCVARDLVKLDAYVTSLLLDHLLEPGPDPTSEPADNEAVELRAKLDAAVDEFTAGRLTASTLAKIEARLLPRIAEVERARRTVVPLELDIPADPVAWWDDMLPERRREIVNAEIVAVTVWRTVRGTRGFDPTRVNVEFR